MNNHRPMIIRIMMGLCFLHQFDHAACHLRHLTFNRWPTIILELGHLYGIVASAINHIELTPCIVG